VQIGLLPAAVGPTALPMHRVIAYELQIYGSHGIAAHEYPPLLAAVAAGRLDPLRLVTREVGLAEAAGVLAEMGTGAGAGVTIVRPSAG
jgi:alcohol dehydrogenase